MRTKRQTECIVIVQGADQNSTDFTMSLNDALATIHEKYKHVQQPFMIPTASSNGRLTVIIQWTYEADVETTNVMLDGLAMQIMRELNVTLEKGNLERYVNEKREVISKMIEEFIN